VQSELVSCAVAQTKTCRCLSVVEKQTTAGENLLQLFSTNIRRVSFFEDRELISMSDGAEIWRHMTFDSINRNKKLPGEEQKSREIQLKVTAVKTEKDLVGKMAEAAKKNSATK
jgi:hypothetical protein